MAELSTKHEIVRSWQAFTMIRRERQWLRPWTARRVDVYSCLRIAL